MNPLLNLTPLIGVAVLGIDPDASTQPSNEAGHAQGATEVSFQSLVEQQTLVADEEAPDGGGAPTPIKREAKHQGRETQDDCKAGAIAGLVPFAPTLTVPLDPSVFGLGVKLLSSSSPAMPVPNLWSEARAVASTATFPVTETSPALGGIEGWQTPAVEQNHTATLVGNPLNALDTAQVTTEVPSQDGWQDTKSRPSIMRLEMQRAIELPTPGLESVGVEVSGSPPKLEALTGTMRAPWGVGLSTPELLEHLLTPSGEGTPPPLLSPWKGEGRGSEENKAITKILLASPVCWSRITIGIDEAAEPHSTMQPSRGTDSGLSPTQTPESSALTVDPVLQQADLRIETVIGPRSQGEASPNAASAPAGIAVPIGHAMWDKALGQYMLSLTQHNVQQAELYLHPPELGRLEVRISLSQGEASVVFASTHAAVRDALETATPRLRQMFEESGLTLINVNISHDSSAQLQDQGRRGYEPVTEVLMTNPAPRGEASDQFSQSLPSRTLQGLVDDYA